jgi:SecD/SecF fusion protein
MNQNNFWKWALVFLILCWAVWEIYPPQSRNLVDTFQESAANRDTNFTAIVTTAREYEKARPNRTFQNLFQAIGTNDVRKYFPGFKVAENDPRPTRTILHRLQRESAGRIKLGLDLQGGTAFMVRLQNPEPVAADTNAPAEIDRRAMVEQAIEVLRKRVDAFGVAEPVIQPAGQDRILIQLPGLSEADIETARTTIEKAAYLEFRMVHPQSDELLRQGIIAPGYEKLTLRRAPQQPGQPETVISYLVKKGAAKGLIGKYVARAGVTRDPLSNQPVIVMRFDSEGAKLFSEITSENVNKQLAIVLDGELYSAPVIQTPIRDGNAQISGGSMTLKEALDLSHILENPLEAPLTIEEQRAVDPSLGKDSITSGIRASVIGVVAVSLFMLVYYLFAGVVANIALILNIIILLGVMCAVGTTLTVPGIAGIVLTIGMAVDANVLIYERIREELAAGKSLRSALTAGYGKAFGTIFDSNLTTLIASVILIFLGTGPVRGFGVALTIGVIVSMFTALMVTRLIFDKLMTAGMLKNLKMLHLVRGSNIDFLKVAKPAFALSWAIILIGIGYGIYRGNQVMGVDFAGGDSVTFNYAQQIPAERVRAALEEAKVGEVLIQYQQSQLNNVRSLQITAPFGKGEQVIQTLKAKFPEAKFQPGATDRVGPVIGAEILRTAIISALLAMFGILVYVAMRYEFSFAVGAVIAIVHDILMTLGIFFLSGRQLSAPIVAAVLTIIGFSINDTIVIFDRIREDLKLGLRGSFTDIINRALNQTLSRTIITSGTVFLATLSLYLFGGGVINDFAFTFLAGIVTGTYSSIYIASALVLWWHRGERPQNIGSGAVVAENTVPARA